MSVRPATTNDVNIIADLLSEFRGSAVDPSRVVQIFGEKFTNSPDRAVLIAETDDGSPKGMCVVSLVYKIGRIECRLDEVTVSEQARGQGLGKQLLDAMQEWAWEHGANEISFTSNPRREAANHLYQKAGYPLYKTNVYQLKRGERDGTS